MVVLVGVIRVDKNGVGPLEPSWVVSCEFMILWADFKLQVLENFNSWKKVV